MINKLPRHEKKSLVSDGSSSKSEVNLWDTGISSDPSLQQRNDIEQVCNEEDDVPIELKLEDFDENDPDMDPLEWSTRKIVPIPQAYYWQTGNYDLPTRVKAWHLSIYALGSLTRCAECVGGVIADLTGLNGSEFDYVTSTMTPEEWEISRRNLAQRQESHRSLGLGPAGRIKPSLLNRGGEFNHGAGKNVEIV